MLKPGWDRSQFLSFPFWELPQFPEREVHKKEKECGRTFWQALERRNSQAHIKEQSKWLQGTNDQTSRPDALHRVPNSPKLQTWVAQNLLCMSDWRQMAQASENHPLRLHARAAESRSDAKAPLTMLCSLKFYCLPCLECFPPSSARCLTNSNLGSSLQTFLAPVPVGPSWLLCPWQPPRLISEVIRALTLHVVIYENPPHRERKHWVLFFHALLAPGTE